MTVPPDLTALLNDCEAGRPGARDRLSEAVYADLRRMAERAFAKRFGDNMRKVTIQPTMLADDTLIKMLAQRQRPTGRAHFFALAKQQMWRLLIDYERSRAARQPRDGTVLVSIERALDVAGGDEGSAWAPTALHDVVARLELNDARSAEVFMRRALFGLTIEQCATAMGVSHATVERDYRFASAWITRELEGS
jgi:RNA polymerase sigma factor (TIGR02999 family)